MLSIKKDFEAFHAENPHVYRALVTMARKYRKRAGVKGKIGIATLFEVLRWNYFFTTTGDFKLNNNYRSRYARMITEQEPDLCNVFMMRELTSR